MRGLLAESAPLSSEVKGKVTTIISDETEKFGAEVNKFLSDVKGLNIDDKSLKSIEALNNEGTNLRLKDSGPGYGTVNKIV